MPQGPHPTPDDTTQKSDIFESVSVDELGAFKRKTSIKINPILAILSPRDIKEPIEAFNKIDYVDKIWFKYFSKVNVIKEVTKFFADHKEYTHIILVIDDVECPYDSVKKLIDDLSIYDFPVLSGCFNFCNVWSSGVGYCTICEQQRIHEYINITFEPVLFPERASGAQFTWVSEKWRKENPVIKRIWFQGFPLAVIRRDVFEKIGLRIQDERHGLLSSDLPWAFDCAKAGVYQFCDFSVLLRHHGDKRNRELLVGKNPSEIIYKQKTKTFSIEYTSFRRPKPIKPEEINPILIIWTPRGNIPEANEAFAKIDYVDKLWLKYFDKPSVLAETKKFFTEHKEYTHMIIAIDDEVCPPDSVKKLLNTLYQYDLPVLCGCFNYCNTAMDGPPYCTWCKPKEPTNTTWEERHKLLNVVFEPLGLDYVEADSNWRTFHDKKSSDAVINAFHFVTEEWRVKNPIIKQVWFQGFPLAIIRRDIYEKVGFKYEGSTDLPWARDCAAAGVPQFCDFSLKLKHLAGPEGRMLQVGKRSPEIVFERKRLNILIIIDVYGWAFDFDARAIKRYSRHNCTIKSITEVIPSDMDNCDVVYSLHWSLQVMNRGIFRARKRVKPLNICVAFPSAPIELRSDGATDVYQLPVDNSVNCIGCYSKENYVYALEKTKGTHEKVYLLNNGIDTEIFNPRETSSNDFIVGWAGNPNRLCKRVHLLEQLIFPVRRADRWGTQYFVSTRSQNEMVDFYHNIDVLISVSKTEGLQRSVLEAMACGLPVVSTSAGAIPELIDAEWIISKDADEKVIINEMNRLLLLLRENPELRKKVGLRNLQRVKEKWASKNMVKICDQMFEGR